MKHLNKFNFWNSSLFYSIANLILAIVFGFFMKWILNVDWGDESVSIESIIYDAKYVDAVMAVATALVSFALLQSVAVARFRDQVKDNAETFAEEFFKENDRKMAEIERGANKKLRDFEERAYKLIIENSASFKMVPLGNSVDAFKYLMLQMEKATLVRNTVIATGTGNSALYDQYVKDVYRKFFIGSEYGLWEDIASHSEIHNDRFKFEIEGFKGADRHKVYVLQASIPIVNFTIVDYANSLAGESRLFIGWMGSGDFLQQKIYTTEDPIMLRTFEKYFELLKSQRMINPGGSMLDYGVSGPARLGDLDITQKSGVWITHSFNVETIEGSTSKTREVEDTWAIIRIGTRLGRLVVEGTVFRAEADKLEYENDILPDESRIYSMANRLYYEYYFFSRGLQKRGFCYYEFERDGGGEPIFHGTYIDLWNRFRNEIVAYKLPVEMGNRQTNSDVFNEYIQEYKEKLNHLKHVRTRQMTDKF